MKKLQSDSVIIYQQCKTFSNKIFNTVKKCENKLTYCFHLTGVSDKMTARFGKIFFLQNFGNG